MRVASFRLTLLVGIATSLISVPSHNAQALSIPGRPDINVTTGSDGTTVVERPGMTVTTSGDAESGTGATVIDRAGVKVETNSAGTKVDMGAGARTITTDSSGKVELNDAGNRIINVQTNADLKTYTASAIKEMPAVTNIEVRSENVSVTYTQPAKLFWFFGSSLKGTVVVSNGGKVEVKLPWYSFLFSKNTSNIKSAVETKLTTNSQQGTISLTQVGAAENDSAENTAKVQNSAKVINIVGTAVNTELSSNTTANTNTDVAETPSSQTTVTSFVGTWSGRFSPNALAGAVGCPAGTVSLTVTSDGKFEGPITLDGTTGQLYGGGNVDANGNVKGGWSLSKSGTALQGTIELSGKLNSTTNTGAGSWNVPGGCSGNFSVTK